MELTLLGSVGLAAFLLGGAAVMLVTAFRRTIELRGALIQAMQRIERLEQALAGHAPLPAIVASAAPAAAEAETRFTDAAEAALAADRIEAPQLSLAAVIASFAAIAALSAAQTRVISGQAGIQLAFLSGAVLIALSEWRRRGGKSAPGVVAASALTGFLIMAVSVLYGWGVLHALTPVMALISMGVVSLTAIGLSGRLGVTMLAFGLLSGASAPALAAVDVSAPALRYFFLAALLALTMRRARQGADAKWVWLAALIALGWGANGAAWGGAPANVTAIGAYFAALMALGLFLAWGDAGSPLAWRGRWSGALSMGAAIVFGACAGFDLLVLAHAAPTGSAGPCLVAIAAFALIASAARAGLWPAGFIALGATVVALGFWPAQAHGVVDAPGLITLGAMLALIFSCGGAVTMVRGKDKRPGAVLAALAPVLIFTALHARIAAFAGPGFWVGAALAIAALNAAAYLQTAPSRREAATPFAAGAVLGAAAALYAVTPPPYAPLALAGALAGLAFLSRWRDEGGLRLAAPLLCGAILVRLVAPETFIATASTPFVLALLFVPSAAAALVASDLFGRAPSGAETAQTTFTLALILTACGATLAARHAFTGEAIGAPYASLAEAGLNTLVWLSAAILMAWRFGPKPSLHLRVIEALTFAAAATHALIVGALFLNPWWGLAPSAAPGWPGANLIEFAFVAPALLFFFYARLRAAQSLALRAGAALSVALALSFVALMLELRRLFHGAAMAHADVSMTEAWTYSLAALGFAALMFALAVARDSKMLRLAALCLALLALGKMALSDSAVFYGMARFGAAFSIGALATALIWLYRGALVPSILLRGPAQPKPLGETSPPG